MAASAWAILAFARESMLLDRVSEVEIDWSMKTVVVEGEGSDCRHVRLKR